LPSAREGAIRVYQKSFIMSSVQCIVVTPEKTEVDLQATSVTVPMFDGELGVLKGHSPMVGRLGYGVLRVRQDEGQAPETYFVEAGFVQVNNDVVSILTDRVTPMSEITYQLAEESLREALNMPSDDPESTLARAKACERARAMKRITST
jgi:F-type H+-transporting ATPase subunit epsilon